MFQRIRSTVDEKEQKQLLMDLDVVMRSSDCQYIVQFYGALFKEVRVGNPDIKGVKCSESSYNCTITLPFERGSVSPI